MLQNVTFKPGLLYKGYFLYLYVSDFFISLKLVIFWRKIQKCLKNLLKPVVCILMVLSKWTIMKPVSTGHGISISNTTSEDFSLH